MASYSDIANQINRQFATRQGDRKMLFDRLNSQFITSTDQLNANPLMKSLASQQAGYGSNAYNATMNNQLSSGFGRNSFTQQLANEAKRIAMAPYQEAMANQGNVLYNQGVQISGNLFQNEEINNREQAARLYNAMLEEEKSARAKQLAWLNAIVGGGMTLAGAVTGQPTMMAAGVKTMADGNDAGTTNSTPMQSTAFNNAMTWTAPQNYTGESFVPLTNNIYSGANMIPTSMPMVPMGFGTALSGYGGMEPQYGVRYK